MSGLASRARCRVKSQSGWPHSHCHSVSSRDRTYHEQSLSFRLRADQLCYRIGEPDCETVRGCAPEMSFFCYLGERVIESIS